MMKKNGIDVIIIVCIASDLVRKQIEKILKILYNYKMINMCGILYNFVASKDY